MRSETRSSSSGCGPERRAEPELDARVPSAGVRRGRRSGRGSGGRPPRGNTGPSRPGSPPGPRSGRRRSGCRGRPVPGSSARRSGSRPARRTARRAGAGRRSPARGGSRARSAGRRSVPVRRGRAIGRSVRSGAARGQAVVPVDPSIVGRPARPSIDRSSSSRSRGPCLGRTNAARTGGGIGESAPLTDFQMISLKTRSSARSSTSRSSCFEASAPQAVAVFLASRSTPAGRARVGGQVGLGGEGVGHRPGGGVELAHRLKAEAKLDRPEHRRRAVHRRVDRVPLDVRADRQGDRAVGVDVVGAVLGVVLDHEDGHLLPEPALAQPLDHPAERQVVVGEVGRRGRLAGRRARGVVVGQPQDDQAGHLARSSRTRPALRGTGRRASRRGNPCRSCGTSGRSGPGGP